jgi:hypothetical protein
MFSLVKNKTTTEKTKKKTNRGNKKMIINNTTPEKTKKKQLEGTEK